MVTGLNIFRDYFADDTDKYVLIGGAACDIVFTKHTNLKERRLRQMIHTALSANHMVDISVRDPGGGEIIKL